MASSTSANEKPSIPLDVVEIIIDILATIDDQRLSSVRICSLACRSFLHFCRKHIFASVTIREASGPKFMLAITTIGHSQFQSFQKLLITAPELVNYVRKLTSRISGFERPSDPKIAQDFSDMLKRFTQIQQLTIKSYWMESLNWTELPDCLQGAVVHLLSLPTIKNIELSNIRHFPILELTRCINLRRLRLHLAHFTTDRMYDHISPTLLPRSVVLEEYFVVSGGFEATQSMVTSKWPNGRPVFDFSHLKEYSAPYNASSTKDTELIQQIFKSANQLVSVRLHCDSITNLSEFSNTIRLALKSLRRITLQGDYGNTVANTWDGLVGLRDQLKVIREWPNVLEELRISILCLQARQVEMMATGHSGWSFEFDECLNHTGWSSLKEVSIEIKTTKTLAEIYHQQEGTGFAQFPFLSSNRAITFHFTVLPMELFSAK